jgi:transcriptional regulator with XRE-family HTH domain
MSLDRHDPRVDDLAIGRSLRAIRVRKRLRQADVAELAHVSPSTVSRVERGRMEHLQLGTIRSVCAVLDVRIVLQARWEGGELDRLVSSRHSAMHEVVARLFLEVPEWITAPEVTFSEFGERGSIDILAWHPATRSLLVIELKTEIVDVQDTVAVLDRKVRLARKIATDRGWRPAIVSAWLLVADGRTNRRRVEAHRTMLRNAYPHDGRRVAAWLREPEGRILALSFLSSGPGRTVGPSLAAVRRVRRPRSASKVPRGSASKAAPG